MMRGGSGAVALSCRRGERFLKLNPFINYSNGRNQENASRGGDVTS